ncbi:MAG: ribonuclease [Erysipelotrichaceae bacterium]|nr:ribonuclease [Erysipelotrichaceae bacterium]
MNKLIRKLLLITALIFGVAAFFYFSGILEKPTQPAIVEPAIAEEGYYNSRDDVALYIHTYNKLPGNFVTKKQAKDMGWKSSKGNLRKVCEYCTIGGDIFTNVQEILPVKQGRIYYECDIDYEGGKRNAKRIVFSNDGLIFYTEDHYSSFIQLYGE